MNFVDYSFAAVPILITLAWLALVIWTFCEDSTDPLALGLFNTAVAIFAGGPLVIGVWAVFFFVRFLFT
jgi:hypothetical protein